MLPFYYRVAMGELGTEEYPDEKHNKRIIEYHSYTGLQAKDDETSWCAAFVCWCLERSGFKSPRSARARDFLNFGKAVETPYEGCIVVFKRPPDPSHGHVGFYVKEDEDTICVLGGNQDNKVCFKNYPKKHLLGYREPSVLPKPTGTVGPRV